MSYIDNDPVMQKTAKICSAAMLAIVLYCAIDFPIRYAHARKIDKQLKPYKAQMEKRVDNLWNQIDSLEQDFRTRAAEAWDIYATKAKEIDRAEYSNITAQETAQHREVINAYKSIDALQAECDKKKDSLNNEIDRAYAQYADICKQIKAKAR